MKEKGDSVQCIELYDIFPRTISGVWQPFVSVAALGNPLQDQVLLHEEQVCVCVCLFYTDTSHESIALLFLSLPIHLQVSFLP